MSETWIMNETLNLGEGRALYNVSFFTGINNYLYLDIRGSSSFPPMPLPFGNWNEIRYSFGSSEAGSNKVYDYNAWTDQAYRTVTFETAPTGDLLTWLEENAVKQPSGYTITYETNGGTPVPQATEQTNLPDPLPTTTKKGYSFDGWYLDSTFETPAVAGQSISEDTTLYAKWKDKDYSAKGSDLVSIANAIRTKGETTEDLVFPNGFVQAINDISGGGITPTGTITMTANGTYDVTNYASGVVAIPVYDGEIVQNG